MATAEWGDAYEAGCLAADLAAQRRILLDFFAKVQPADWSRLTEKRASAWTLRQTLAHVAAVAEGYQLVFDAALAGRPMGYPGMASRADLTRVNAAEIAARSPADDRPVDSWSAIGSCQGSRLRAAPSVTAGVVMDLRSVCRAGWSGGMIPAGT